ncbi:MAG: response regulator transcription factor [Bacteroides sp.]|jgi:DNA-binding NarL/FixJ family response regulator|nr:response regulator transcription factor [Bacteroides sp.]
MEKINVLVIDDHDLIILACRQVFSKIPDMKLIGVAKDGDEGYRKIVDLKPDVVIIDISIPGINGIELTRKLTREYPDTKVVLHSSSVSEEVIVMGFEAGAMAYVPKNFKPGQLVEAIRTVMRGEHYSKGFVSDILIENFLNDKNKKDGGFKLTDRELEILRAIAQGSTNQNMAELFCISVRTVEAHKANIMKKLKLSNTAELVVFAIKNKIVKI